MSPELSLAVESAIIIGALAVMMRIQPRAYASIIMFLCMTCVSLFGSKLVAPFGFVTNAGNIFYAGATLCMTINFNIRGSKYSFNELRIVTFCMFALYLMVYASAATVGIAPDSDFERAVDVISNGFSNVVFASLGAFVVAQTVLIMLLQRLRDRGAMLSYVLAAMVAQAVDSVIFFFIFFAQQGVALTFSGMATGFAIKVGFAVATAPALKWLVSRKAPA